MTLYGRAIYFNRQLHLCRAQIVVHFGSHTTIVKRILSRNMSEKSLLRPFLPSVQSPGQLEMAKYTNANSIELVLCYF